MFCPKCGAPVENAKFCPKCGTPLQPSENTSFYSEPASNPQNSYSAASQPNYGQPMGLPSELMDVRNIALCIILSLVTCGIYELYWIYQIAKRIRLINYGDTDCVVEYVLLLLIPFYGWYWIYTRSQQLSEGMRRYQVQIDSLAVVNLILAICGFGIVGYALMQDQLNQLARTYGAQ